MKQLRIAIDGPAGAGKSTVSKLVAEKLGYSFVDTGAMYRSVAYAITKNNISTDDENGIKSILPTLELSFKMDSGLNRIFLNNIEITKEIREEAVSMIASRVSALPFVRDALFALQRSFAEKGGVVMEGRDIGTVIMPDAEVKIFLTASPENRAKRRLKDLEARGETKLLQVLADEIRQRDEADANRAVAPLKPAFDAILLDNSDINLEETAEVIVALAKKITG